jgi:dTDP-4-dehydrorhamnose 3,5-epimerase
MTEQIVGVELKELKTFPDDRGFFREVVRYNDPFFATAVASANFAQLSHSKMGRNTIKAWHYHHQQTDWWYCALGVLHTVLFDLREESPTFQQKMEFIVGEQEINSDAKSLVIKIPPGVAHGCKVISDFAHLFYITNQTYNPEDEGRYPFNSNVVTHDWGQGDWIVAQRDTVPFEPKNKREKIL